ncbi:hypothetical protein TNCV_1153341 [Trichonephila clavipes]|nr:hypothetical protein TNCV_1153341 [Trichonephila clavipes]
MASGSYMTPIYSRSQSEVQGDHHKPTFKSKFPTLYQVRIDNAFAKALGWEVDCEADNTRPPKTLLVDYLETRRHGTTPLRMLGDIEDDSTEMGNGG